MIADVAYNKVVEDFQTMIDEPVGWIVRDGTHHLSYYTNLEHLHILLSKHGIRLNKRWFLYKGKDQLPDLSILVVNRRRRGSRYGWHWVVCERNGETFEIYDPCIGQYEISDYLNIYAYAKVHT